MNLSLKQIVNSDKSPVWNGLKNASKKIRGNLSRLKEDTNLAFLDHSKSSTTKLIKAREAADRVKETAMNMSAASLLAGYTAAFPLMFFSNSVPPIPEKYQFFNPSETAVTRLQDFGLGSFGAGVLFSGAGLVAGGRAKQLQNKIS